MRRLLLALLATPVAVLALARSAGDYFHAGAAKFVGGRLQEASVEVEEGLRNYPDDPKLKSLGAHLKDLKDQQKKDQGSAGSQNSDQKNDKDKQKQDQKDKQNGSQGQDKQGQDKDKQDQEKKDEQKDKEKQGQEQQADGNKPKDRKNDRDSSGQSMAPVKPGQMSKEEAERLLNSYQDDEKKEHKRMGRKPRPVEVEEDW